MKVDTIITGSWYPRTRFHLQEWRDFLVDGKGDENISKTDLKKSQRKLMPDNVEYIGLSEGGRFDRVVADLDGFTTSFYEDGLMLLAKKVKDLDTDYKKIHKFYSDSLSPSLRLIYSIGAPSITFREGKEEVRKIILITKSATEQIVENFLKDYDDTLIHVAKGSGHAVYFANNHIVIVTNERSANLTDKLVTSLVFFTEFEARLDNFLNLHRKVWTNIQEIRDQKHIRLTDLPQIRDTLLDNQRDLTIVKTRLEQMRDYLIERKTEVDETGLEEKLRALEVYRYGKMNVNALYMNRLWNMLGEYISSTLQIVDLMYQENIQRQLNVQQFIFLVGSIGGLLMLGRLGTEKLSLFTDGGELAYLGGLILFGSVALLISIIVFMLIKKLSPLITGIRTGHPFGNKRLLEEEKPE